MVKTLRQIGHGTPEIALQLADEPVPRPGRGEIVVAIEVAAVHGSDVLNLTDPKRTPELPRIGGTEGVGRICAVGDGVENFKIGQRVFPPKYSGFFREHVRCAADKTYLAPEGCAAEALSVVQTMGLTAQLLLDDYVNLPSGAWIIHDAANSSIGRILIGLAHHRGLKTVNVVRREGFESELKALGGDAVIVDPGDADELENLVRTATGGAEIGVALDMIGGSVAGRLAHCLSNNGTLVLYGGTGPEAAQIEFIDLVRRNLTVTGMSMSQSFNRRSAAEKAAIMIQLGQLAAEGVIKTKIAGRYKLDDYRAAFTHAAQPNLQRDGKVVFVF